MRMTNDQESEFNSLVPSQHFDRRNFLATAIGSTLGVGFALAVQPVFAQSVITTSSDGLLAGEVDIPVANNGTMGVMKAYRAQPANPQKKLPVVLVVSEIFGVHAYITDVCRRLAKEGYLAIAPQLFARQGDPSTLTSIPDIQKNIISKVPDAQVKADLDATVTWAGKHGGDSKRLAITGFCWGGRITWLYTAHNPAVRAGVAWYGRLRGEPTANTPRHPINLSENLNAPVLGLYGGQDQGIPLADVDAMREKLKAAGSKSEIVVYADAPHAFHADYRPSYREAAAKDGWQRALAWLKKNGV